MITTKADHTQGDAVLAAGVQGLPLTLARQDPFLLGETGEIIGRGKTGNGPFLNVRFTPEQVLRMAARYRAPAREAQTVGSST